MVAISFQKDRRHLVVIAILLQHAIQSHSQSWAPIQRIRHTQWGVLHTQKLDPGRDRRATPGREPRQRSSAPMFAKEVLRGNDFAHEETISRTTYVRAVPLKGS